MQIGMGWESWRGLRLKSLASNFRTLGECCLSTPFFDLKESLVHPGRIVQVISIGNTIEVLVDSKPFLPSQFLVSLPIVYLF